MNIDRFVLLLAVSAVGPTTAVQADSIWPARTYELSVANANGDSFLDCGTFTADHALVLAESRGLIVDWLPESTDPSGRKFHAVSSGSRASSNPYGLALHGRFVGANAIRGDAVNDRGLTFTFTGRLTRACTLASTDDQRSPYAERPSSSVVLEPGPASVAGTQYGIQLYGEEGGVIDDCYIFAINGTLTRSAGASLTWGLDGNNEAMGTFQAVGSNASAGLALRGELASWGELRVHGIASSSTGLREIVGSGRDAGACLAP
jgi:hypothetical protein